MLGNYSCMIAYLGDR